MYIKHIFYFVIFIELCFIGISVFSKVVNQTDMFAIFGLSAVLFPLVLHFSIIIKAKRYFKTAKILHDRKEKLYFTEDGLGSANENSDNLIKYNDLYKIVETNTNFYLFISNMQAFNVIKSNCSPELIDFLHKKAA